ncbi:alanine racemase C-terminal domain-containing protein [Microbacterium hatanonis]|uniref:Alanine racemase n=1 Tax=Microbacterium hatanonis TaxID=404366 RepID=A0A5C8I5B9_9MICO|nr:alanine racemase C-terminal domain-containing protein [Microbacterium hatanonis]TXK13063.1 alanine racemase [Microbacterium hatanonis]
MTGAFRERAEGRGDRTPLASVSRAALLRNAVASRARTYTSRVLRSDAWGHGADAVVDVLSEAGLTLTDPAAATPGSLDPVALFGLPGGPEASAPALRFSGAVLATKDLRAGEGVSYGYLYRAAADTRIALVTGGYGQGVVRSLGGSVDVSFAGRRHPIVGRVAMDVCVVEIADAAIQRGDEAVFFGDPARDEPSLGEWCAVTGLSGGELATAAGLHATRRVVG